MKPKNYFAHVYINLNILIITIFFTFATNTDYMFNVNEYFEGKVKSISFSAHECPATLGVMAPGEYEFGTSTVEYITVVSGMMTIQLPGETEWKDFKPYETFVVDKDKKFKLKITTDSAYVCLYK